MKKLASVAAMVALAAALVACGDDDDAEGAGTSDASISKDEYVAQANAICEAGQAELAAALAEITAETTEEEAAGIIADAIRAQITELRALGYPEGDQETLESIYGDAEALLDEIEADPSIVTTNEDPFTEVNDRLASYGLTACAE